MLSHPRLTSLCMSKPCPLVKSVGNFHLELLFWFFLHQWVLRPASVVASPFKDCHLFVSFQSCSCFFSSSSQQQYSQINPLKLLFLHATCIEFYVVSERECSKFCCFVYTFTLQVWVSAWKKKNCLQICDWCGLFIHSSSTEILSQNSLFYTYSLFYTFIHKHLKILKCSHRTASRKLFCSKRRVAESESSSLHHRYGWNNSSHWVPLQQDITVLLGGWNKSDENTRFTKPPSCHSKVKPVREHWFQVTSLQIFTSHFINACH